MFSVAHSFCISTMLCVHAVCLPCFLVFEAQHWRWWQIWSVVGIFEVEFRVKRFRLSKILILFLILPVSIVCLHILHQCKCYCKWYFQCQFKKRFTSMMSIWILYFSSISSCQKLSRPDKGNVLVNGWRSLTTPSKEIRDQRREAFAEWSEQDIPYLLVKYYKRKHSWILKRQKRKLFYS